MAGGNESKDMAVLFILEILKEHSSYEHPLTQEEIGKILDRDYGITLERKAISRKIANLVEAEYDIVSDKRQGSYLDSREFEDAELRLLIDSVLCSKHVTANKSKQLIAKLCKQSNKYFKAHVSYVYSVDDWDKTDNKALFYNIETVDSAIAEKKKVKYEYNKFGIDKKLHKSSSQVVSPYMLILHNQRYYLMAYSEYWGNMVYHRLDHISKMEVVEEKATPIRSLKGYENGVNYKKIATSMPYMYADKTERIQFLADEEILDQIVDWFGKDIVIQDTGKGKIRVNVESSLLAMENWALQYLNHVEIETPKKLREMISKDLKSAIEKYK